MIRFIHISLSLFCCIALYHIDAVAGNVAEDICESHSKLHAASDNIQGTIDEHITTYQPRNGKQTRDLSRHITYAIRGDLVKIEVQSSAAPGTQSVIVYNDKYRFAADKEQKTEMYVSFFQSDTSDQSSLASRAEYYLSLIYAGEYIPDNKLSTLLSDTATYNITTTGTSMSGAARDYVELKRRASKGFPLAWAIVDPQNYFQIIEGGFETTWGTARCSIEYQHGLAAPLFPKKITKELKTKEDKLVERREYIFSAPEECKANRQEFTLEAYGLPIPRSMRVAGVLNLVPWIVIGVFLLLACLVVYRIIVNARARRKS